MPPVSEVFRPGLIPIFSGLVSKRLSGWRSACRRGEVRTSPPEVINGCNLLVPRTTIHELNGFDEDFRSWGYEDADFVIRAWHAGVGMGLSGCFTTVFHIHHPSNAHEGNKPRFDECVASGRIRCENGIMKHSTAAISRTTNGTYTRVGFRY